MRQSVLLESWRGRYDDNPRAISELLRSHRPDLEQVWVAGTNTALPPGVRRVRRHSPEYFARLFGCSHLITNDIVSKHLIKGPRVTYLQTWHGTPLKTLGFDEKTPQYSGAAAHLKRTVRDVAKWDYLISPSAEITSILRGAFDYDGTVLETGYPRNDILKSSRAPQLRHDVRRRLGLEPDQQVVLYAPTWRDDSKGPDGDFRDPEALDLKLLRQLTGPRTVLLTRMHRVVRAEPPREPQGFTMDVTSYPDIAELYLAADVLVSDYSSTVFDFAVTGKPIILFAYDLERYRDDVRGMYFDYETWAPGVIVRDTASLAAALADVHTEHQRHLVRYQDFVRRFCPHEDGHASERVVERIFA